MNLPDTSVLPSFPTVPLSARMPSDSAIEEAAQEFESVFIAEMLKPMFEGVQGSNTLFGGGKGEEMFQGFLIQHYGDMIAKNGGLGLADHVKAELVRLQEERNGF